MHEMPQFLTPSRQETPSRQGLYGDCIEDRLCRQIIDAAIEVHKVLGGPGLLESIYEEALYQELILRKVPVKRQVIPKPPQDLVFGKEKAPEIQRSQAT
jgi:hypothetical protein